jgi:hypothetical protein
MLGSDAIYYDYNDRPADPASPMNLDPKGFLERTNREEFDFLLGKKAIHGHFNIIKYRKIDAKLRIVFIREPTDRIISHYFFWKTMPRNGHSLHEYFLDHNIDIESFAKLPMLRYFYTSTFFSGVDMNQFDLVGFHDRLAEDFAKLRKLLNIKFDIGVENINTSDDYKSLRQEILSNSALLGRLRDLLRDDLVFYETLRAGEASKIRTHGP